MKETFWISTQLSSTKLTQNGTQLTCSRRLSRSWIMCLNMHDYTWEFQTVTQKKVFLIPLSPSVCIYGLVWLLAFLSDIVVVTWHKAAWGDSIKVRKNCHHLLWFWHTDTCFQPLCCANSGFLIYDSFYSVVHIKRLFCGSQAEVWIWAFFHFSWCLTFLLSSSGPLGPAEVEGSSRPGHGHPWTASACQRRRDRQGEVWSRTGGEIVLFNMCKHLYRGSS